MGDELTLGEIWRAVQRIEKSLEPLAGLPARVERTESDVQALANKVDTVATKSAVMSGGIAGVAAVLNFLFGRH